MPAHIENTVVTVLKQKQKKKQSTSKQAKNTPKKLKYEDRDFIFSYFH